MFQNINTRNYSAGEILFLFYLLNSFWRFPYGVRDFVLQPITKMYFKFKFGNSASIKKLLCYYFIMIKCQLQ